MAEFNLSWTLIICAILCGIILSCVYCTILWYSVKKLPHIKHKGLFLFITSAFRLILFLIVAIFLAIRHPILLLCMFIAFIITRLIIVKKKGAKC